MWFYLLVFFVHAVTGIIAFEVAKRKEFSQVLCGIAGFIFGITALVILFIWPARRNAR